MKVRFTSIHAEEVGSVLNSACLSLQNEFEELRRDSEVSQSLDQIAIIVTAVAEEPEVNRSCCASPVSVSSNENYVTGEKAKILTIRLSIPPSFILQNSPDGVRNRILSELVNVVSNIKTKRILDSFDRERFVGLVRSKIN